MNKFLTSAHTKRSRLRNLYLQNKTDASKIAYIKQWNYCASHLNKTKKVITQILMKKTLQIKRAIKPFLLDKAKSSENINLIEGEEMTNVDEKNAKLLNDFFSNAVKNLKITEYHQADPLTDNISHPMFKVIIKFRNLPSVTPIKNLKNNSTFSFCGVSIESIIKEIKKLSTRKATQYTDFLFKI